MRILNITSVLVASALESGSRHALNIGRVLAHASGATLHVVHVGPTQRDERTVREGLRRLTVVPEDAILHILTGDPAPSICRLAHDIDADVVIVGPHRRPRAPEARSSGNALGSTAMSIVTDATVPCLVARRRLCLPLEQVIVAVDGSAASQLAVSVGLSWTSALRKPHASEHTRLLLLHVLHSASESSTTMSAALARLQHDAGSWSGVTIETATLAHDDAAIGIVDYVNHHAPDLVVLGTRGVQAASGTLGSVAASVIEQIHSSVLLVPPGFRLEPPDRSRGREHHTSSTVKKVRSGAE